MPKIQKNIYFPEKQWEHLRKLSQQENLPIAEIVRCAVDAYLAWRDPDYPAPPSPAKERTSSPG